LTKDKQTPRLPLEQRPLRSPSPQPDLKGKGLAVDTEDTLTGTQIPAPLSFSTGSPSTERIKATANSKRKRSVHVTFDQNKPKIYEYEVPSRSTSNASSNFSVESSPSAETPRHTMANKSMREGQIAGSRKKTSTESQVLGKTDSEYKAEADAWVEMLLAKRKTLQT
jgi:hypothetical protein